MDFGTQHVFTFDRQRRETLKCERRRQIFCATYFKMSSRQVFAETEKICLQELVLKYHLNVTSTKFANPNTKKIAWMNLTEEFNSISTNTQRTEAQLRKCWDNLKTRRKGILRKEKWERMKTGGGRPQIPPTVETSDSTFLDDALLESKDVELDYGVDSDTVSVSTESTNYTDMGSQAINPQLQVSQSKETMQIGSSSFYNPPPRTAPLQQRRLSESLPKSRTNIRSQVIADEFVVRQTHYTRRQEMEEELHKLRMEEQMWKVRAAEELYLKCKAEKEAAEEMLKKK